MTTMNTGTNTNTTEIERFIARFRPRHEVREWLREGGYATMQKAWVACKEPMWMLWLLNLTNERLMVLAAAGVLRASLVGRRLDEKKGVSLKSKRSLDALATVEKWAGGGKVSLNEIIWAWDDAFEAYHHAVGDNAPHRAVWELATAARAIVQPGYAESRWDASIDVQHVIGGCAVLRGDYEAESLKQPAMIRRVVPTFPVWE